MWAWQEKKEMTKTMKVALAVALATVLIMRAN
jgi:hypothetical protein